MGGEKLLRLFWRMLRWGSPPRGQGKVGSTSAKTVGNRITPAWAGKSIVLIIEPKVIEDHPRVGGEKMSVWVLVRLWAGSPPRGRGKVRCVPLPHDQAGITPAWAGKSLQRSQTMKIFRDHPRVGGEKSFIHSWLSVGTGSPPRGRGKAQMDLSNLEQLRITPAWAGKSSDGFV